MGADETIQTGEMHEEGQTEQDVEKVEKDGAKQDSEMYGEQKDGEQKDAMTASTVIDMSVDDVPSGDGESIEEPPPRAVAICVIEGLQEKSFLSSKDAIDWASTGA